MDNLDLPMFPPDFGFPFKDHTVEELCELFNCKRRTLFERLEKIRPFLGKRIGNDYHAEQVIVMCLLWTPPTKYFNAIKWMELHGWAEYYKGKFNLGNYEHGKEMWEIAKERKKKKLHSKKK